jgi:hypothetical protein
LEEGDEEEEEEEEGGEGEEEGEEENELEVATNFSGIANEMEHDSITKTLPIQTIITDEFIFIQL